MNCSHILYSDFNCPFCYGMHERLYEMTLLDGCLWRGVQHAPHLSTPMTRWNGTLGAELRHEVTVVQRLAPGVPITVPSGKPNTGRAIQVAAALLQEDAGRGMALVRQVYRAFWCDGLDLSDAAVLLRLAQEVDRPLGTSGLEDGAVAVLVNQWHEEWQATGQSGVPLLIASDGRQLVGLAPERNIKRFVM